LFPINTLGHGVWHWGVAITSSQTSDGFTTRHAVDTTHYYEYRCIIQDQITSWTNIEFETTSSISIHLLDSSYEPKPDNTPGKPSPSILHPTQKEPNEIEKEEDRNEELIVDC
jgi:hypothetical protein